MASRKPARFKPVDGIKVNLWGKYVGAVALDPNSGFYAFAYEPSFLREGIDLAPLQMPISQYNGPRVFADLPVATYKRLPAFIADALPDDFGNALVDRYMADRGLSKAAITPLDRLAYAGKRAMGALEFEPARGPKAQASAIDMGDLVQSARDTVAGRFDGDAETDAALRSIIEVGTSANGARAKAVIGWNPATMEICSGHAALPAGYQHWLLKFDGMGTDSELGASQDYGRIEYAYHLMARAADIDMTDCRLLEENSRAHFMTRRFDRDDAGNKFHVQSLCAMAHVDFKLKGTNAYSQLFMTIVSLGLPRAALLEAYRRMVFNVMARNCDDHTKNTSFLLKPGQPWALAPAYDVTFAHNPVGEWTKHHLMAVNGKYDGFAVDDLLQDADRFAIGEAKSIIRTVRAAIERWPEFAATAGVGADQVAHVAGLHMML